MNYPHRGQDSVCKLHYPTSHNMELFEFIELRADFFPHWSDPVQDYTPSPFAANQDDNVKIFLNFVSQKYH